MKRGYIALWRKMQEHPLYQEKRVFSKYEAWLDILMEVRQNLEAKEVVIGMDSIQCGHGQSIYSLRTWGKRWGWSGKKVSRFFKLLKKMNQIEIESVRKTTRITVLNYSKYDPKCHKGETKVKHECPTNNNVKNVNNNIPDSGESGEVFYLTKKNKKLAGKRLETFNQFWAHFNYKKGKAEAADAWLSIPQLTNSLVETIYSAAKAEAANRPNLIASGKTPKWAQGWITGRRWEDEPAGSEPVNNDSGLPTIR